jgi:hypothetical protein
LAQQIAARLQRGHPKVCDLDVPLGVEEQVLRLEVPVAANGPTKRTNQQACIGMGANEQACNGKGQPETNEQARLGLQEEQLANLYWPGTARAGLYWPGDEW